MEVIVELKMEHYPINEFQIGGYLLVYVPITLAFLRVYETGAAHGTRFSIRENPWKMSQLIMHKFIKMFYLD